MQAAIKLFYHTWFKELVYVLVKGILVKKFRVENHGMFGIVPDYQIKLSVTIGYITYKNT